MALAGPQSGQQASSQNGPASGGPAGGTATFSMMGGFMREMAFANAGSRDRGRDGGGGSSGGGSSGGGSGGWGGEPGFYFDEWLGLWVDVLVTNTQVSFLLYEDEAKTLPAGSIVSSFPEAPEVYPQTYSSTYQILAGMLTGSHGTYQLTMDSELIGSMSYENVYPHYGKDQGSSHWDENEYTWSGKYEDGSGFRSENSGTFRSDGSGLTSSEDSLGYRSRFTYRADGTGEGLIEGPDPGLPATITWDAEGNVRIRWADGTIEEFNWFWCVEGAMGTGVVQSGG